MKLLVVVSEFPKITETFAIANVLHYLSQGHDARVFHLKPFRHDEIVHDEARPVIETAFTYPWLSGPSLGALAATLVRRPVKLLAVISKIVAAMWRDPGRLAGTLAILPKSLALGRYAKSSSVDHIHAEFASHPATSAWIASEVYGVPFSFSAHMYDIFVSQSLLAEKSTKAEFVRTISDFNADFLSRIAGFAKEKIAIVRCGVDPARFPARDTLESGPPSSFNITYVGSLQPRKGVDVLLRALVRLKYRDDWHLTVVGGGPESDRLKEMAKTDLPGRVTFAGPATMAQVKQAMYRADLVVVPSIVDKQNRSEGIPVVSMEALAAGCPVIASRLAGIPELIEDGATGHLFTPGNIDELAAKIEHVFAHYEQARIVANHGRARVLETYNINRNAAELLKLIEEHIK